MLVVHVLLLFATLNPLVIPFGLIYFCVAFAVVKNQVSASYFLLEMVFDYFLQLIHVYAKNYEGSGRHILIRLVRYSLDGKLAYCLNADRFIEGL